MKVEENQKVSKNQLKKFVFIIDQLKENLSDFFKNQGENSSHNADWSKRLNDLKTWLESTNNNKKADILLFAEQSHKFIEEIVACNSRCFTEIDFMKKLDFKEPSIQPTLWEYIHNLYLISNSKKLTQPEGKKPPVEKESLTPKDFVQGTNVSPKDFVQGTNISLKDYLLDLVSRMSESRKKLTTQPKKQAPNGSNLNSLMKGFGYNILETQIGNMMQSVKAPVSKEETVDSIIKEELELLNNSGGDNQFDLSKILSSLGGSSLGGSSLDGIQDLFASVEDTFFPKGSVCNSGSGGVAIDESMVSNLLGSISSMNLPGLSGGGNSQLPENFSDLFNTISDQITPMLENKDIDVSIFIQDMLAGKSSSCGVDIDAITKKTTDIIKNKLDIPDVD